MQQSSPKVDVLILTSQPVVASFKATNKRQE